MIGMLACSLIPGWFVCNLLDRLTPDGPPSPITPGIPRFEPIPLYPIRFYWDMSLNCLWCVPPKPGWPVNFCSKDVFLPPRLPPYFLCPDGTYAELEPLLAPVLLRLLLFQVRAPLSLVGLLSCLLVFCCDRLVPLSAVLPGSCIF